MNRIGHHATGAISGIGAASYLGLLQPSTAISAGVCIIAGWHGGVFPDSVEHVRGRYWVAHRTVTHWVPAWIALAVWLFCNPEASALPYPGITYPALVGFSVGGITHLVFDWPNPTGIPWLHPWKRHSLKLWKSGRADTVLIVIWATAISSISYSQI
ncbi:metal-dependent hydrolase [Marinobacter sp. F3R08]|uniref:metal-dependent hydrolase n=1 Tax=Marinobacter sp. F3R08 TaxID=2841559 RepID=UPI001C095E72|nr:metal-dependent hydrolase [Marinobacter sp. F3R08]